MPISLRGAGEHNKPPAEHCGRGGAAAATLWPRDMMSHSLYIIVVHLASSSLSVSKLNVVRSLSFVASPLVSHDAFTPRRGSS